MILGKRFAALRRERYLTQEEFAQRLEMSPANVRRLEQLETGGMQVKNFRRLATLLNISPDDLRRRIGAAMAIRANRLRNGDGRRLIFRWPARAFPSALEIRHPARCGRSGPFSRRFRRPHENRTDANRGRAPVPAGPAAVCRHGGRRLHGTQIPRRRRRVFSVDAAESEGIIDGKNYFMQFTDGENTFKRIFLDPENRELLILRCWNERYPPTNCRRSKVKLLARAVIG